MGKVHTDLLPTQTKYACACPYVKFRMLTLSSLSFSWHYIWQSKRETFDVLICNVLFWTISMGYLIYLIPNKISSADAGQSASRFICAS